MVQLGQRANQRIPWDFQCGVCVHYQMGSMPSPKCAAYPEGIPTDILYNEVDHRQPQVGDHGIRFEAVEDEQSPFEFYVEADEEAVAA